MRDIGFSWTLITFPPGGFYCFGDGHPEVYDMAQYLHVRLNLGIGPWCAQYQIEVSSTSYHHWILSVSDSFPWSEAIDVVGVEMPVSHSIVK